MYKPLSYYRSVSSYPATARIVQTNTGMCTLFICHDVVGTIKYFRGTLSDCEKVLFSFIPYGYTAPLLWKKEKVNGN